MYLCEVRLVQLSDKDLTFIFAVSINVIEVKECIMYCLMLREKITLYTLLNLRVHIIKDEECNSKLGYIRWD